MKKLLKKRVKKIFGKVSLYLNENGCSNPDCGAEDVDQLTVVQDGCCG